MARRLAVRDPIRVAAAAPVLPEEHAMLEPQTDATVADAPEDVVAEDLLVEDVSIDGMCGVY
jgi:mycofactocin precursor